MRLGLYILGDTMRLSEIGQLAAKAEAAGLDSVWTGEYWHSGFQAAAAAARATARVRIGTGIVQAFPRSPLATAIEALDLDEVAGGRLILGLGPQVKRYNERLHGIEYGRPVPRMREYVQALTSLWALASGGSPVMPPGEYYGFDFTGFVRPVPAVRESIPIYLAAVRPAMTRLAAECADGLVAHPMSSAADLGSYQEWSGFAADQSGQGGLRPLRSTCAMPGLRRGNQAGRHLGRNYHGRTSPRAKAIPLAQPSSRFPAWLSWYAVPLRAAVTSLTTTSRGCAQ